MRVRREERAGCGAEGQEGWRTVWTAQDKDGTAAADSGEGAVLGRERH